MENLKTKAGTIFNIQRPSFRLGTTKTQSVVVKPTDLQKINKRSGLGNYDITRRNFEASEIRPRIAGDFDKLQAIDIETQGAKIQLSDKTIEELFKTKVGDKTDTQWLAEKARLTALYTARGMTMQQIERELEVNKPLGREQRKITSNQNIGQSSLSLVDKLEEIKHEVEDGRAESRAQQAVLTAQLALIFADTQAISQLSQQQFQGLAQTVARLNLPRNHKQIGLEPRYVDIAYYNANQGLVNLFLFSNITSDPNYGVGIDFNRPIYNFAGQANGIPAMAFTSAITAMGRGIVNGLNQRRYLDLDRRGLINHAQLMAAVNALPNQFANANVSIAPANR